MINEAKLEEIMMGMGFQENLSGTETLRQAVRMYRPGMSITKELYPALAEAAGGTPSQIERRLRHSIRRAFDCAGVDVYRYFGNGINPETGVATNSLTIARLAYLCREGEPGSEPNT